MKKLLTFTALAICLGAAQPAMAFDKGDRPSKEEFKKMTPEERQAFRAQKDAEWKALSKEEKLKVIEDKRAENIKKMDDKWKSMSDDEKIKFAEERKERRKERFEKRKDRREKRKD